VVVTEEIVSPELVLVSPPELAARARRALPDLEPEWQVVARLRAEAAAAAAVVEEEPPARLTLGAVAFTIVASATSVAPLVVLILLR
jgi:hypothetical protein